MGEESAAQCTSTDGVSPAGPSDRLRDTRVSPTFAAKHNPERPLLPPQINPAMTESLVNILFALALGAVAMAWSAGISAQPTASAETVRSIQMKLTVLGYEPGPADGLVGPSTIKAVRAFQVDQGLPETGELTQELLSQLDAVARMSGKSQSVRGGVGGSSLPGSQAGSLAARSSTDTDGDGLTNELELQIGTDPENPDTDGDGVPDGFEMAQGRDPLWPEESPESSQTATVGSEGESIPDGQIQSEEEGAPKTLSGVNTKLKRWKEELSTLRDSLRGLRDLGDGRDRTPSSDESGSTQPEFYPPQETFPGQEPYAGQETYPGQEPSPAMVDTDGDGYPDEEELAAGSDPYNPASRPDNLPPPPITQPASTGEASDTAARSAAPKPTLSGSVIDTQRRPIPGAEVRVGSARTRTDTRGRFRVQNLEPGPYQVSASARGYHDATRRVELRSEASQPITLALAAIDRRAAPAPAPAVRPAQVIGQVLDPGKRPIAGAEVRVGSARTRTDTRGRFRVQDLEPGPYQVSASARDYRDTTRRVELRSGASQSVTLVLAAVERKVVTPVPRPVRPTPTPALRPAEVIGQVLDPGKRPVVSAEVRIGDKRTRTDKYGRFSVPNLEPGHHEVRVSARGYRATAKRVQLKAGTRQKITLVLAK